MISTSTVLATVLADYPWGNLSSSLISIMRPTVLSGYIPGANSSFFKPTGYIIGHSLADYTSPSISDSLVSGNKKSVSFVPYNDSDYFTPGKLFDTVLYEFILTTTVGSSNTVRQYWGT